MCEAESGEIVPRQDEAEIYVAGEASPDMGRTVAGGNVWHPRGCYVVVDPTCCSNSFLSINNSIIIFSQLIRPSRALVAICQCIRKVSDPPDSHIPSRATSKYPPV